LLSGARRNQRLVWMVQPLSIGAACGFVSNVAGIVTPKPQHPPKTTGPPLSGPFLCALVYLVGVYPVQLRELDDNARLPTQIVKQARAALFVPCQTYRARDPLDDIDVPGAPSAARLVRYPLSAIRYPPLLADVAYARVVNG